MHRALFLIIPALTACSITAEEFVEDFAAQKCANIDACGKISETHGTLDECITYYEIVADEQMIGDGCAIISDKAKECLNELEDTEGDCPVTDKLAPACAEVGDCAGGSSSGDTGQ
jgi:hypothetical protein